MTSAPISRSRHDQAAAVWIDGGTASAPNGLPPRALVPADPVAAVEEAAAAPAVGDAVGPVLLPCALAVRPLRGAALTREPA